jgi:phosphate/sulfate permease
MRGLLAILAILIFSRIYYIIADNKKNRRSILIPEAKNSNADELPYLFAVFLLLLAGMPILR